MVISVKDALERRFEGTDISELCEQIDQFLERTDADEQALAFDIRIGDSVREHIVKLYTDVGWHVEWEEGRDGPLLRIRPK